MATAEGVGDWLGAFVARQAEDATAAARLQAMIDDVKAAAERLSLTPVMVFRAGGDR